MYYNILQWNLHPLGCIPRIPKLKSWDHILAFFYLQNELHRNQQRLHSQQHACTLFKISKVKSRRSRNVLRSSEKGMQDNPKASRKKTDILRSCSQNCPLLTSFYDSNFPLDAIQLHPDCSASVYTVQCTKPGQRMGATIERNIRGRLAAKSVRTKTKWPLCDYCPTTNVQLSIQLSLVTRLTWLPWMTPELMKN